MLRIMQVYYLENIKIILFEIFIQRIGMYTRILEYNISLGCLELSCSTSDILSKD